MFIALVANTITAPAGPYVAALRIHCAPLERNLEA